MRKYLLLYVSFCLIGAGLEWCYGTFWSLLGTTPWVYPNSPLHYTSFEGVLLWGFGGLVCVSVYRAYMDRRLKRLLGAVIPLVLAAIWISIYARFIA